MDKNRFFRASNVRGRPWHLFLFWLFTLQSTGFAADVPLSRTQGATHSLPLPARTQAHEIDAGTRTKSAAPATNLFGTAVALAIIIGALVLVGRGLKRLGFKPNPTLPIEAFELLGKRTIEPRLAVHLVKCGRRVLVVSIGPEGARTLSEIDDPAEVQELVSACRSTTTGTSVDDGTPITTTVTAAPTISGSSRRILSMLLVLLLSLSVVSPLAAQQSRAGNGTARQRETPPQRKIPGENRAERVQPASLERVMASESESPLLGPPQQLGLSLKLIALMSVFSLAPSILMMTTCFVRFIVALGLLRQALGTQQGLPNQVLTAICLFMTILVMSPVWQRSYDEGIRPYTNPKDSESPIDEATAMTRTLAPIRSFMSQQIDRANNADAIWMLLDFQRPSSSSPSAKSWHEPQNYDEVPLTVLAPAYLLSELKVGFLIGFQLFLPFLVIDLVVASILTSLGLTMLPPSMISLPFKLLLFVLIDGWFLTVGMLLESVRVA